jgi:indole-3-glycerol phosphate synthase
MRFPDPLDLVRGTQLPSTSHLQRVLASEAERVQRMPEPSVVSQTRILGDFEAALRRDVQVKGGALIAEYKQGSPSLGPFAVGTPLLSQLEQYKEGGASAFSILCEPSLFLGDVAHLSQAASLEVPRLYKGFVIAPIQLREAASAGANAILLIARVLKQHTAIFAETARELGLEPLVELHDLTEVGYAQEAKARLVGINARDLSTFTLGAPTAAPLREAFPDAVLIRESGLHTPEDAAMALRAGFDSVLIGEALMRSANPKGFLERVFLQLREGVGS